MNLNTSFKNYRKRSLVKVHQQTVSVSPSSSQQESILHVNLPAAQSSTKKHFSKKYNVLYRKYSNKKHKTWEGDGELILNLSKNFAIIKNEDGLVIGKLKDADKVIYKNEFRCSGFEFQLDEEIINSKQPKLNLPSMPSQSSTVLHSTVTKFKSPLINKPNNININRISPSTEKLGKGKNITEVSTKKSKSSVTKSTNIKQKKSTDTLLYDISNIPDPLFMPDPPRSIDESEIPKKVVVDPSLSCKLRPHQREGVKFLYRCLMGLNNKDMRGAILADEMGLGKTLQTITLIWTLLRQSPIVGSKPVIEKVLICCPVSLVNNWKNEFSKWLGMNRLGVLTINNNKYQDEKQDIKLFGKNKVYQVMIMGYEKMQTMSDYLAEVKFDLLVCDEGHRLKSGASKAMQTLESFNIRRRILLTGTPIQNDLTEFYMMANFSNPGILGDLKSFQKNFIKPILESRDSNCLSDIVARKGREQSKRLVELTNSFIIRRSNVELTKYLPKRSDYIIFVPPTALQLQLFKTVIETRKFKEFMNTESESTGASSFNLINTFRKICNSPSLLKDDGFFLEICERASNSNDDVEFRNQLGKKVKSGKILVLIKLLGLLHNDGDEKVVIVSNFTSTLNIIESIFKSLNLSSLRLDGSTPSSERGKIVNTFNKSDSKKSFALLLSAKAGGVGLNLIGASRLILFDNDWNPAVDLQAVARIHRDGQQRNVKIYRLLTNGCIDEKIFQRQLVKQDLSDKFVDQKGGEKELFDRSDIKDIFTIQFERIKSNQYCNTHELMCCECKGNGSVMIDGKFYNDDSEKEKEEEEETGREEEVSKADEVSSEKKNFMSAFEFSEKYSIDGSADDSLNMKRKKLRRCMKGYRHIDGIFQERLETDDEILNTLLNGQDKEKPLVSFVFGKY
jgi:DNA repair and recombination protein RAD54B